MRIRSLVPVCSLIASLAYAGAPAHEPTAPSTVETVLAFAAPGPRAPLPRPRTFSLRSLTAEVDARVLANLLVDTPARSNGIVVTVSAGEVNRCEGASCHVPLTVRVAESTGPVSLTFAVANAKGVLSDVQHAECGTGSCSIDLVLEKGRNTLSLGALDGVTQTSGFKLVTINASRPPMAGKPKIEWF
jgi:hypothetical protein